MRIGLYGIPTAGKSYILDRLDFIKVMAGSRMLREICPDFDAKDEAGKTAVRQELADMLATTGTFIMDGHYAFGDKIAFTEKDGLLYDVFLYLHVSPEVLRIRMEASDKNRKYLAYDIEDWQRKEIESLRDYCHANEEEPTPRYISGNQVNQHKSRHSGYSLCFSKHYENDCFQYLVSLITKMIHIFLNRRGRLKSGVGFIALDYAKRV